MKKISEKLLFILVLLISISLGIMFFIVPKEDFSEIENRYLAKFSINNIHDYLYDHFPFKTHFISLKNNFELKTGHQLINDVYITDEYLIPKEEYSNKKDSIISIINKFSEKNDNVNVMIIPDSVYINRFKINNLLIGNEKEDIDYFYQNLKTNNINIIEAIENENNKNNNQYYHTDHHWTSFGAYTAYKEYLHNKGITYLSKEDFKIHLLSDSFKGTSSSLAIGLDYQDDIYVFDSSNNVEVEYVKEKIVTDTMFSEKYLSSKDKYSYFLDNNHALIKIKNLDLSNNKKLVVVKNSFANCLIPMLINHYQEIYVVDLRYYGESVSDLISDNQINETLIIYNLNNLYTDLSIAKLK